MKKLLLGTTMLVGAALASTGAMAQAAPNPTVSAAPFTVTLRGFTTDSFVNANEKGQGPTTQRRTYEFRAQNRFTILADAVADNGLKYGLFDRIDLGNNGDTNGVHLNRSFGYVQGSFGRVEFGQRNGIVDDVSGFSCGGGFMFGPCTGEGFGLNGDLFIDNIQNTAPGTLDVLTSHSVIANNGGNKLLYRSPVVSGFQLGLGYTPDNQPGRVQNRFSQIQGTDLGSKEDAGHLAISGYRDVMEALVEYKDTFGPVGADIVIGGDYATPKSTQAAAALNGGIGRTYNTAKGLTTAWHFTYAGFGLQWTFNDDFDSRYARRATSDTFYQADDQLGGAVNLDYTVGPYTVGAWYAAAYSSGDPTKRGNDTWSQIGLGGHYIVAPGLMLFGAVEFDRIRTDQVSVGVPNNSPTQVAIGTQILF